jgi:MFS family permease
VLHSRRRQVSSFKYFDGEDSDAPQALQVILTQGMLYGIGSGLLFAPCVSFIDEWFLERRGLANGLLYLSSYVSLEVSRLT